LLPISVRQNFHASVFNKENEEVKESNARII